ncbi:hypothetical protein BH24ACT5_BH24ACT5_00220 [soil metagenome]
MDTDDMPTMARIKRVVRDAERAAARADELRVKRDAMIFDAVRFGEMSRGEVARATGLSLMTVSRAADDRRAR